MHQFYRWPLVVLGTVAMLAGCDGGRAPIVPGNSAPAARSESPRTSYAKCIPAHSGNWWEVTFSYAGRPHTWTVPPGVANIEMIALGAQGSNSLGGCASGSFAVTPGAKLSVFVGGQGLANGTGGYNGGGKGGSPCCAGPGSSGGGAGGASDVRTGGVELANRILVAGGGGGSSGGGWAGGTGGGATGGDGQDSPTYGTGAGKGGTQTAGGAGLDTGTSGTLGAGGDGGAKSGGIFGGGAGGGGYYGGGGGRASFPQPGTGLDIHDSGGGGGSGFVASQASNPGSVNGVRYGNGSVIFTWPQQTVARASGLREPKGIAVDVHGTVYIAVKNSSISTVAADGTPGFVGSGFERPYAVAVDPGGNVYVSDTDANKVWKVSPPFKAPDFGTKKLVLSGVHARGIGIDGNGNLYVPVSCGYLCGAIDKIAFNGKTTQLSFPGVLRGPVAVAVDATCMSSCSIFVIDEVRNGLLTLYPIYELRPDGHVRYADTLNFSPQIGMAVDATGAFYTAQGTRVIKHPFGGPSVPIGGDWSRAFGVAVPPECVTSTPCPVYISDEDASSVTEVR